ncbi:hypothetical protein [Streptomyces sp. NPDC048659]|uniref:hypothetical protein n=1 Tax=Streptomyces sp. NPDC048659 TaxID=3155489 RepID=UPI0034306335
MERGTRIDNTAGIVVVGDGNRIAVGTAPPVRSAYREQVRRLAPAELVGREEELAELAAFCRADGPGCLWWRADAWAGKTALMAHFALAPPPGVRIVAFFVTARWAAQNDAAAFLDVVLEQLAELAAEPLPALLTAATRQAHLLRLYGTAARACAARGERLVLLVDGLDEDRGVTTGPDAHSIAALLPYDLPVIASGRLNPPLPADVPEDHPLRDPAAVRLLAPSPSARAVRVEAERELKRLLTAGGLPYDLLALLTAAGGGLTADDLAELTAEVPYRVRDLLRTGHGRTFAPAGPGYLLAHEELAAQAREMLGVRELDGCRDRLHAWADRWRGRGWPEGTPEYLLRGYVAVLRAAGDAERLAECALDPVRHDRLLAATGGDGAALDEVRVASEAVLARAAEPGALDVLLSLALRRAALRNRNGRIPPELPAAWAELGAPDRALALARGLAPEARVHALCAVAEVPDGGPDAAGRTRALLAEAEAAARETRETERTFALWRVGSAWIRAGEPERAAEVLRALPEGVARQRPGLDLIGLWAAAGEFERVRDAVRGERDRRTHDEGLAVLCAALAAAGRPAEALDLARAAPARGRALALIRIAGAPRGAAAAGCGAADLLAAEERAAARWGQPDGQTCAGWAAALVEEGLAAVGWEELDRDAGFAEELVGALVANGAAGHAERLTAEARERWAARDRRRPADGILPAAMRSALALGLVAAGDPDRAEELARELGAAHDRERVLAALAEHWAGAGAVARIEPLLAEVSDGGYRLRVARALVEALAGAGRCEEAEALAWREGPAGDRRVLALKVGLVRALTAAGVGARAAALLGRIEAESRAERPDEAAWVLGAVAEALALGGRREAAHRLTEGLVPGTVAERRVLRVVRGLVAAGRYEAAAEAARGARPNQRDHLLDLIARCRGTRDPRELAEEFDRPVPGRGCVRVGIREAVPRPLPAPLEGASPRQAEGAAAAARALHAAGRDAEAAAELARAVGAMRWVLRTTLAPLPAVALAQRELGAAGAAELLDEAEEYLRYLSGGRETAALARACVAAGLPDRAVALALRHGPVRRDRDADDALDLVKVLARAGEHARAERLLAGLAPLGPACTPAYAVLAVEHPDPARARELAALALHLGPWYEAAPAVLAREPGTADRVVAEAERLRALLTGPREEPGPPDTP